MGDSGYGHGKHFHVLYKSFHVCIVNCMNVDVVMCHCMCILGGE